MTEKELQNDYEAKKYLAERFAKQLSEQIKKLLETDNISLAVPMEYRIKEWSSLKEKVKNNELELNSILELNDFIGLRIILLFHPDVDKVCEILNSKLEVKDSEDTTERLGDSEFGYQSVHLQVTLPDTWLGVPTFNDFRGFKAEVQVRTAAQHIWAAASHELQYKNKTAVPLPVRRSINRVAALLETVDLEFERTLIERKEYSESADVHEADSILNVDLLKQLLDELLGFDRKSSKREYDLSELLQELNDYSITNIGELRELIDSFLSKALQSDKNIVNEFKEKGVETHNDEVETRINDELHIGKKEMLNKGYFRSQLGLIRYMLKLKSKS